MLRPILLLLCCLLVTATAADVTWSDTPYDADWSNGMNWIGGSPPTPADRALIPLNGQTITAVGSPNLVDVVFTTGSGNSVILSIAGTTMTLSSTATTVVPENATLILNNGSLDVSAGSLHIERGGLLMGVGTVGGNLRVDGTIMPYSSSNETAPLQVTGNLALAHCALSVATIGSFNATNVVNPLTVGGTASLNGTLFTAQRTAGLSIDPPWPGTITLLSAGSISGAVNSRLDDTLAAGALNATTSDVSLTLVTPPPIRNWTGGGGNTDFNNAANWSGGVVPGPTEAARIKDAVVTVTAPVTVARLSCTATGALSLQQNLTVTDQIDLGPGWTLDLMGRSLSGGLINLGAAQTIGNGSITSTSTITVGPYSRLDMTGSATGTLVVAGTLSPGGNAKGVLTVAGDLQLVGSDSLSGVDNAAHMSVFEPSLGAAVPADTDILIVTGTTTIAGDLSPVQLPSHLDLADGVYDYAVIIGSHGGTFDSYTSDWDWDGTVYQATGDTVYSDSTRFIYRITIAATSATAPGITWRSDAADHLWSNSANWEGGQVPTSSDLVLIPASAAYPEIAGTVTLAGLRIAYGGELRLAGGTLTAPVDIQAGGVLNGAGTVVGDVMNAGSIYLGSSSPGALIIQGDLEQLDGSNLSIKLGELAPGPATTRDSLDIQGDVIWRGSLVLQTLAGSATAPTLGSTWTVATSLNQIGSFSSVLSTLPDGAGGSPIYLPGLMQVEVVAWDGVSKIPAIPSSFAATFADPVAPGDLKAGQTVRILAYGGTPPYQVVGFNAVGLKAGSPAAGALLPDGRTRIGQLFIGVVSGPGPGYWLASDAVGSQAALAFQAGALPTAQVAQQLLLPSQGGIDRFMAVCPSTPQGLLALRGILASRPSGSVRAFAWDASAQSYVELPAEPSGGLSPLHGIFLASTEALALDFSGYRVPAPVLIPLLPGWNFIGIPPIEGNFGAMTRFSVDDLELVDQDDLVLSEADSLALMGGAPLGWNADLRTYQAVNEIRAGQGYWVRNASADGQTVFLRLQSSSFEPNAASPRSFPTKALPPPPAPGTAGSLPLPAWSAGSDSGCGNGLGLVLGLAALAGVLALRRKTG